MIHPRGNVPINRAHLIARLIFAHLFKIHPLAFEDAMVLPRQRLIHQTQRAQFDLTNFFEDFFGNHRGMTKH